MSEISLDNIDENEGESPIPNESPLPSESPSPLPNDSSKPLSSEQTQPPSTPTQAVVTPPPLASSNEPPPALRPSSAESPDPGDDEEEVAQESEDTFEPAEDLKGAFVQLAQTERMPESTKAEKELKTKRLALVRRNVCALQQGLPSLALTANDVAAITRQQSGILRRQRLELLARDHPEIRALLTERDQLAEELAKLKSNP